MCVRACEAFVLLRYEEMMMKMTCSKNSPYPLQRICQELRVMTRRNGQVEVIKKKIKIIKKKTTYNAVISHAKRGKGLSLRHKTPHNIIEKSGLNWIGKNFIFVPQDPSKRRTKKKRKVRNKAKARNACEERRLKYFELNFFRISSFQFYTFTNAK